MTTAAPTNFQSPIQFNTSITLGWQKGEAGCTYKLYESTTSGLFNEPPVTIANNVNYESSGYSTTITDLIPSTTYFFKLEAVKNSITSNPVTFSISTLSPDSPANFKAVSSTATSITCTWTNGFDIPSSLKLYKSTTSSFSTAPVILYSGTTYTFTGLSANTKYFFQLVSYYGTTASTPLTTSGSTVLQPTAFAAPTKTTNAITLKWTKAGTPSSYLVYKTTPDENDDYDFSNVTGVTVASTLDTYTFTGLTQLTKYYFQIIAISGTGNNAVQSIPVIISAITTALPQPINFAPTIVTVPSNTANTAAITFTWTANGSPTSYLLYKGEPVEFQPPDFSKITGVTVASTATSYAFTGLKPTTQYFFQIIAVFGANKSIPIVVEAGTVLRPTNFLPSKIEATAITFTWTKAGTPDSYLVGKSTTTDFQEQPEYVAGDLTTYKFTGLSANTQYYFQILALNGYAEAYPVTVAVSTVLQPKTLTATSTASTVVCSWVKAGTPTSYKVYKSLTDGNYALVSSPASAAITYTFTDLAAFTTYYFQIVAIQGTGNNAVTSYPVKISKKTTGTVLPTPTNFKQTAATATSATFTWTKVGTPTSYKVYRSLTNDSFTAVTASLSSTSTSFIFTGLTANTRYYFQLAAVSGANLSVPVTVTGTTVVPPTALSKSTVTTTSVKLNWVKATTTPDSYYVYRSTTATFTPTTTIQITVANSLATYTFTGRITKTNYYFRIVAVKGTVLSIPVTISTPIKTSLKPSPTFFFNPAAQYITSGKPKNYRV